MHTDSRRSRLYVIWCKMRQRCLNSNSTNYERYGGRGISICSEWLESFSSFRGWAIANGYADNLTIDRINNDGNYEPTNCRWATAKEQANNRRPRRLTAKVLSARKVRHSSPFRGVYWSNRSKRWFAEICVNGKHTYIGRFKTALAGAIAYDRKAIDAFGDIAVLNFPEMRQSRMESQRC